MPRRRNMARRRNKHEKDLICGCGIKYTRADFYLNHKEKLGHTDDIGKFVVSEGPLPDPDTHPRHFYCLCGSGFTASFAFKTHLRRNKHEADWVRSRFQPRLNALPTDLNFLDDANEVVVLDDAIEVIDLEDADEAVILDDANEVDAASQPALQDFMAPEMPFTPNRPISKVPAFTGDSGLGSSIADPTPVPRASLTVNPPPFDPMNTMAGSLSHNDADPFINASPREDDEAADAQLLAEEQTTIEEHLDNAANVDVEMGNNQDIHEERVSLHYRFVDGDRLLMFIRAEQHRNQIRRTGEHNQDDHSEWFENLPFQASHSDDGQSEIHSFQPDHPVDAHRPNEDAHAELDQYMDWPVHKEPRHDVDDRSDTVSTASHHTIDDRSDTVSTASHHTIDDRQPMIIELDPENLIDLESEEENLERSLIRLDQSEVNEIIDVDEIIDNRQPIIIDLDPENLIDLEPEEKDLEQSLISFDQSEVNETIDVEDIVDYVEIIDVEERQFSPSEMGPQEDNNDQSVIISVDSTHAEERLVTLPVAAESEDDIDWSDAFSVRSVFPVDDDQSNQLGAEEELYHMTGGAGQPEANTNEQAENNSPHHDQSVDDDQRYGNTEMDQQSQEEEIVVPSPIEPTRHPIRLEPRGLQSQRSRQRQRNLRQFFRQNHTGVTKKRKSDTRMARFGSVCKDWAPFILGVVAGICYLSSGQTIPVASGSHDWVLDSTAAAHIAKDSGLFSNIDSLRQACPPGPGQICDWTGTVPLEFNSGKTLVLEDVLYRPRADSNVVSMGKLGQAGLGGMWTGKDISITNLTDNDVIGRAGNYGDVYKLDNLAPPKPATQWPSYTKSDEPLFGNVDSPQAASIPSDTLTRTFPPYQSETIAPKTTQVPAESDLTLPDAGSVSADDGEVDDVDMVDFDVLASQKTYFNQAAEYLNHTAEYLSQTADMLRKLPFTVIGKHPRPADDDILEEPPRKKMQLHQETELLKQKLAASKQRLDKLGKLVKKVIPARSRMRVSKIEKVSTATPNVEPISTLATSSSLPSTPAQPWTTEPALVTQSDSSPSSSGSNTTDSITGPSTSISTLPTISSSSSNSTVDTYTTISSLSTESSSPPMSSLPSTFITSTLPTESTFSSISSSTDAPSMPSSSSPSSSTPSSNTNFFTGLYFPKRVDTRAYALDQMATKRQSLGEAREQLRESHQKLKDAVSPPCPPCPPCSPSSPCTFKKAFEEFRGA